MEPFLARFPSGSQPPPQVLPGTESDSQHKPCGPLRWTEQCLQMNCANPGENASLQRSQAWLHALSVQPQMMNFPCGRHPGTIATGPNSNSFLTFPLLTSCQGEKIYLRKIPWTGSQKARRICASSLKGSRTGSRVVRSTQVIQAPLAVTDASCGTSGQRVDCLVLSMLLESPRHTAHKLFCFGKNKNKDKDLVCFDLAL